MNVNTSKTYIQYERVHFCQPPTEKFVLHACRTQLLMCTPALLIMMRFLREAS